MMRIASLILSVVILTGTIQAQASVMVQPYYTTDILTYMDGIPIKGYSLNGRMMIELESLESYGFSVSYDDTVRALFVNKTNEPYEDFSPCYERGVEGNIAGYTYESDIRAYVNGRYIPTESVNGRLLAVAEDLARVAGKDDGFWVYSSHDGFGATGNAYDSFGRYNTSMYFMNHTWNSENRTLHISNTTGSMPRYDELAKAIKTGLGEGTKQLESFYGTVFYNNQACFLLWKDGKYSDLEDVFSAYGLTHLGAAVITNAALSNDKKYLYFDSKKERAVTFGSHVFESYDEGRYRLDLKNFIIERIS